MAFYVMGNFWRKVLSWDLLCFFQRDGSRQKIRVISFKISLFEIIVLDF